MTLLLEILYIIAGVLLFVPAFLLAWQVVLSLPFFKRKSILFGRRPRVVVLMPAHNESDGIARPLNAIRMQLQPGDRVLVVADNCSDDTAEVARANGAEVVVRTDPERRGKGYALDFGVRQLMVDPPEVVIVVDADCIVHGYALDMLARYALAVSRPVQALYLMHAPEGAGLKTKVAEFAWAVKNWARPLGYHHMGLPCQLMGTGMAFPWALIKDARLATGHIVEDLKLGLDFAAAGYAPHFCPGAHVSSVFASNSEGADSQRTRWEHGSLGMLVEEGLPRLEQALRERKPGLLALALDLCVPPLALLTLLVIALCILGAIGWLVTGDARPWLLAFIDLGLVGGAVLLAWLRFGRKIISLPSLAYAPFYALSKIPLYLKFLFRRQAEWVRSRRD
jgi:cellulose synthase/poly-beta-1,6-N-acetylglucosamine synthase-like glycosyltransferase